MPDSNTSLSVLHWLIGGYGLPSDISRHLELTKPSSDINHGGRTKSTCSGLVLAAEHLRAEDIKMYYPWQQPGKRGSLCDVLRRAWRPAGLNVGGGTWGRFEAGFLNNITFKTSHATTNCSSNLFRPVRRSEIILLNFPSTNVHSLYHKFTYLLPFELCAAVSSFLTPIEDHLSELFGVVRRSLEASGAAQQRFLLSNFIQNFKMILF